MPPPARILSFSSWNARGGLAQKKPILAQFLKDYSIGILLLQETMLIPTNSFTIQNYLTYRNDRTFAPGGGTAILIRRSLPHTPYQLPQFTALECTAILLGTPTTPIIIISAYKRPHSSIPTSDLNTLNNLPHPFILAGDINSKYTGWGCSTSNIAGLRLDDFLKANPQIHIKCPPEPTHTVNGNPHDILDFVLHSSQLHVTIPNPKYDLYDFSDHFPIVFTSSSTTTYISPKPPTVHNTNWKSYKHILSKKIKVPANLPTSTSIDKSIEHLTHHILRTYKRTTIHTQQLHPTLPDKIILTIRLKRQIQRRFYKHRRDEDKILLKQAQRQVHRLLQNYETNKYNDLLNDKSSPNNIHKVIKAVRDTPTRISPIYTTQNSLTFDPQIIADTFAQTLADRFRDPNIPIPQNVLLNASRTPTLPLNQQTTWTTNDTEIRQLLTLTNKEKAPGPDGIRPTQLHNLPKNATDLITLILNSCFKLSYFPSVWKTARVSMIPKPSKDHRHPTNYRPISLLPILSKIFEKVILLRLTPIIDPILDQSQFGFREGRSAALQTLNLTLSIATPLQDRKEIPTILTDLTQAYDTISHPILLAKIRPHIPDHIHSLLQSYLTLRSFHVQYYSKKSPNHPIQAGVPQGAVLSPLLFSLYINDIPSIPGVEKFLYADDLAFLASFRNLTRSLRNIQKSLDSLHLWASQNSITINPSKSQAILFSYKTYPSDPPPLTINQIPIPWQPHVKYLGITLSRRLLWSQHVLNTTIKTNRITNALYPILSNPSIPIQKRILAYNTYIRPTLSYAHPTWFNTSIVNYRKLTVTENRVIRIIFRPPPLTYFNNLRNQHNMTHILTYLHNSSIQTIQKFTTDPQFRNLIIPHHHILRNPPRHTRKKHPLDILQLPPPIT